MCAYLKNEPDKLFMGIIYGKTFYSYSQTAIACAVIVQFGHSD